MVYSDLSIKLASLIAIDYYELDLQLKKIQMKEYVDLISAIATLLWPIFAFTVLFTFKKQITNLLERIKKGKVFGQEIELSDSLLKLGESAATVAQEVAAIPLSANTSSPIDEPDAIDETREILREAVQSPKAALLLLASDLEREARQLLASVGHLEGRRHVPLTQAIEVLDKQFGGLPGHIPSSLRFFWEARNKLIHGGDASDEDILRAIDSGITILKALKAFPREVNVVYHPGVDIFHDPLCRNRIEGVKGVILETESPGGTTKTFRIYPSTLLHYVKNKRVAWEWSFEKTWGEAWYKDPDTKEIKPAWSSAAEFVGRHLDEV